ncbi:MAG TPA: lytic transglycosylase domain-containing protein [Candidatus Limnocylindria bacterium]|nr:lytic transglycosylase domain-containing protein [Candidatus Limnocylindria bacterium]
MVLFLGRSGRAGVALALAGAVLSAASPVGAAGFGRPLAARYADALGTVNGRLTAAARLDLAQRLLLICSYYRLDPRLLVAVVTVESSWRARAVSPSGAEGLGQLMPATAATLEVDALEPYENLDGTARYLRRLLNRYAARSQITRMELAIASYNAGPAAVAHFDGVPPYRETQAYVASVIARWRRLAATLAIPSAADLEALTAPASPRPRVARARVAHGGAHPKPTAAPRRIAAVPRPTPAPTPTPTASPVVWERSHSLFARLLGLRHRVSPQRQ